MINIELEKELLTKYKYILGIDEVGRGPWAGPMGVGFSLISKTTSLIDGVDDSKKVQRSKRIQIFSNIKTSLEFFIIDLINEKEIDEIGISKSLNKSIDKSIKIIEKEKDINIENTIIIIDGEKFPYNSDYNIFKINKADSKYYSVASASIIAKVERDEFMKKISIIYPEYNFENNVGYGTKDHINAINQLGLLPIHRFSYKPIQKVLNETDKEIRKMWKYYK